MGERDPSEVAIQSEGTAGTDVAPREVHVSDEERKAALAAGAPKVPRKVVAWGFVVAAALALGGTLGERLVSSAGLNPKAGPTTTVAPVTTTTVSGTSPADALLAFVPLTPVGPPRIELRDQRGRLISLVPPRGDVEVITFFNASCADACRVVSNELRLADHDLGRLAARVRLITVNTDPLRLAPSPPPPAVTSSGLTALSNWHYLTGPLSALNPIWKAFGITISVYLATKAVVHNDVLYLVDQQGKVVSRGSPFSDESRSGVFSLPGGLERVAGRGLATDVAALLRSRS